MSAQIRAVEDEIKRAARSDAKVLVTGESGVGKEIVAQMIHQYSARNGRPFVAMNCAGVPDSLLESELFGHVRGSFTGAYRDKPGLLEQAHGGTMLLDEIGEMSLRMQALLLRFLDDGDIQRVGAERCAGTVNVRIVAATNRVLPDHIAAGEFRKDLYYRLNVIQLAIPPLRARRDDIEPLLQHFLNEFGKKYEMPVPELAPEVVRYVVAYDWPGNVRELRNVAERLIVRGRGGIVRLADLPGTPPNATDHEVSTPVPAAYPSALPPPHLPAIDGRPRPAESQLLGRMIRQRESFWSAIYLPYIARDLTRADVRAVIAAGLRHTRGNYRMLLGLFNMEPADYKRFLNFLRKHQCHFSIHHFRDGEALGPPSTHPLGTGTPPRIS